MGIAIGMYAGIKYFICVDRYGGYPLVGKLGKSSNNDEVIKILQGWFRTLAKPRGSDMTTGRSSETGLCTRLTQKKNFGFRLRRSEQGFGWVKLGRVIFFKFIDP